MVSDLLHHLDMHKSIGLDGIHPRVLRDLSEELARPLSVIYNEQCWLTREVPFDWILASVMPRWETTSLFGLISVPGKVVEQLILSAVMWHMQDRQGIQHSQYGFMKSRSCLSNMISCDKVTCLVKQGKAVYVVYLNFSKACFWRS